LGFKAFSYLPTKAQYQREKLGIREHARLPHHVILPKRVAIGCY